MFLQTKVSLWWFGRRFGLLHSQATAAAPPRCSAPDSKTHHGTSMSRPSFPLFMQMRFPVSRIYPENFSVTLIITSTWVSTSGLGQDGGGESAGCRRRDLGNGIEDNDRQFINYGIYHLLDIVSG